MKNIPPLLKDLLLIGIAALAGASWLSEVEGLYLAALLLPILFWQCGNRLTGYLAWFAYYAMGSSDIMANYQTMMNTTENAIPAASWWACSAILALPWLFAWTPCQSGYVRAKRSAAALLVSILPPLGYIGWLNPLLLSGLLFPGFGNAGLILTLLLLASIGTKDHWSKLFVLVSMLGVLTAHFLNEPPREPKDWIAFDTHWGRPPEPDDNQSWKKRIQQMNDGAVSAFKENWKVIIFPEYASGYWSGLYYTWWIGADIEAMNNQGYVVFGASELIKKGQERNQVILLDGKSPTTYSAPLPMPLGMWKPWAETSNEAFPNTPILMEIDGRRAHVSVCYEEFMIYPKILAMNSPRKPDVSIGIASTWFAKSSTRFIQKESHQLMARLYGTPLLRAVAY